MIPPVLLDVMLCDLSILVTNFPCGNTHAILVDAHVMFPAALGVHGVNFAINPVYFVCTVLNVLSSIPAFILNYCTILSLCSANDKSLLVSIPKSWTLLFSLLSSPNFVFYTS